MPKIFEKYPMLLDIAHPKKSLKSIKTTGKTLGQTAKKRAEDKIMIDYIRTLQGKKRRKAIVPNSYEDKLLKQIAEHIKKVEREFALKKASKNNRRRSSGSLRHHQAGTEYAMYMLSNPW